MNSTLYFTYIVLILKLKNPALISDYRLISLINVLYKFVAKVITNSLKLILPHIISSNQYSFILSRLNIDNVKVAYE